LIKQSAKSQLPSCQPQNFLHKLTKQLIFTSIKILEIVMEKYPYSLHIPLNFNQIIDIVRQLRPEEKSRLKQVLESEQDIPENHKEIVRKRMKASQENPERLLNWDEVKHTIKL
jgi:hypothetical protein